MSAWQDAEPNRARDCEVAFQAGGPRVYVYSDAGLARLPWDRSAANALRFCAAGNVVYSRRKVGTRYVWQRREVAA